MRRWIRRASTMLARRRPVFLAALLGLGSTDALVAFTWPDDFRAQAIVMVTPATRPQDAAPAGALESRLDRIVGLALADAAFLEDMARRARLDRGRAPIEILLGEPAAPVDRVARRIHVGRSATHPRAIELEVTASSSNGVVEVAHAVTDRLLALDRDERQAAAARDEASVAAESSLARAEVAATDSAIAAFRRDNPGVGAETESALRARLAELERAAAEAESQVAGLEVEVSILEAEHRVRQQRVSEELAAARRAKPPAPKGGPPRPAEAQDPRREKLARLQDEFLRQMAQKTEVKLDVRGLLAEIERLRQDLEQNPPKGAPPKDAPKPPLPGEDLSPEDARLVVDLPSYGALRDAAAKLEASRRKLSVARGRLARDRADRDQRCAELAAFEKSGERRAELARLAAARERQAAKRDEVLARLARARRAVELEAFALVDRPDRLEVLVAARLPDEPVGPERLGFFLVGLLLALPIALLAAYVREVHDRSLHDDVEAAAVLGLPILGSIPHLRSRS